MIFSHYQTRHLMDKNTPSESTISTDLGRTTIKIQRTQDGWQFPNGARMTFSQAEKITEDQNNCFRLVAGELIKVEKFSPRTNRYYSLMPTATAPTMLISGIPMHRIKNTTPLKDTQQKIKALGKPYGHILDTATGLGYTAIQAAQTAKQVVTIELDPAVLQICRWNPWSQDLFDLPNIQQIIGDSGDLSAVFEDETFDAILHDPPMFNLAGHLYAQDLYGQFFRILKPGGRLFHYIGNPESRLGARVGRGVVARLQNSGFTVRPKGLAFGVLAVKKH